MQRFKQLFLPNLFCIHKRKENIKFFSIFINNNRMCIFTIFYHYLKVIFTGRRHWFWFDQLFAVQLIIKQKQFHALNELHWLIFRETVQLLIWKIFIFWVEFKLYRLIATKGREKNVFYKKCFLESLFGKYASCTIRKTDKTRKTLRETWTTADKRRF